MQNLPPPSSETPLTFPCRDRILCGILHPARCSGSRRGVVIVVGGPQYRVGSHRQFVLLARHLAERGVPVLRFDYRGMGDSEGGLTDFSEIEDDIRAAVDTFTAFCPELEEVVLWGLCDAASATAFYGFQDDRVGGLVLLNPWVRTDSGEARTRLKHYYLARLGEGAFWKKLLTLRWEPRRSLAHLLESMREVLRSEERGSADEADWRQYPLPERMLYGLQRFSKPVLVILSGQDLTAREFEDAVAASTRWREWMAAPCVTTHRIEEADHTFSRRAWRDQVAERTEAWLRSW
ncbi:hydrolase 1, exosortase A system-associated [Thiohalorhabdus methylotrophus]|uniref:Hydrolase 1, exosortase A system-associated n=1 Tax=Thiohalorhabdus methylotrophus TaxID=3242694 RepID=A0ABV4TUG9_9GAMM